MIFGTFGRFGEEGLLLLFLLLLLLVGEGGDLLLALSGSGGDPLLVETISGYSCFPFLSLILCSRERECCVVCVSFLLTSLYL